MTKKKKNTRIWSKAGNIAKKVVPVIVASVPFVVKALKKGK
ncbi:hypothetical protein [Salegentibacter salarius]|nr:hypothetical protein [Salegentibacter salarius]SLJ99911.1 hypothetical protein SAMN05660445_02297 [Salegentibacter salarius]